MASVSLQPRDLLLLQGMFECRVMTLAHIAAIFFEDRGEAAKKRVRKLKVAGYIAERPRRAYDPSVLFLTRKAFELLRNEGFAGKYPQLSIASLEKRARVSDLTIRHELDVLSVKAAFHKAVRQTEHLSIAEFGTWPILYEFPAEHPKSGAGTIIKPDGFVRIHEREADAALSEHTFFLEVDRSTETQETLVAKASCYVDFYRRGGFAVRNGADREQFREFPFRVLVACKSKERRDNFVTRLASGHQPILTQVAVSIIEDLTAAPLGKVWITPANRIPHSILE